MMKFLKNKSIKEVEKYYWISLIIEFLWIIFIKYIFNETQPAYGFGYGSLFLLFFLTVSIILFVWLLILYIKYGKYKKALYSFILLFIPYFLGGFIIINLSS